MYTQVYETLRKRSSLVTIAWLLGGHTTRQGCLDVDTPFYLPELPGMKASLLFNIFPGQDNSIYRSGTVCFVLVGGQGNTDNDRICYRDREALGSSVRPLIGNL